MPDIDPCGILAYFVRHVLARIIRRDQTRHPETTTTKTTPESRICDPRLEEISNSPLHARERAAIEQTLAEIRRIQVEKLGIPETPSKWSSAIKSS